MPYGHFDDRTREYIVTEPVTPRPWINYLGNRRLSAFISQTAGGLLWHLEPLSRRLSRYHFLPAPGDQPGFYVYVRDRTHGTLWNPHAGPTFTPLDQYQCRHSPGITRYRSAKDGIETKLDYGIPPDDDVFIWRLHLRNTGHETASLQLCSYLEFGLLEFMREAVGWCYLKSHFDFSFDPLLAAIRYNYHVYEAPYTPRLVFACAPGVTAFDCSRESFVGRTGTLAQPRALSPGQELGNTELPLGGHGCGALALDLELGRGQRQTVAWVLAVGDSWDEADALVTKYQDPQTCELAFRAIRAHRLERLDRLAVADAPAEVERWINTWNPMNCLTTLELARRISTDHAGLDGLRYRDTTQDALAVASIDPLFAIERMRQVFAQQKADGSGCFAFWPHCKKDPSDEPVRADNTVWQIETVYNIVSETGEIDFLDEEVRFRDSGELATIYDHILVGLEHIYERRGRHGLPKMAHADWNDSLCLFADPDAESVMLGMQLVRACRDFARVARFLSRGGDADWCISMANELAQILNSEAVWDGNWYRRLLLSDGRVVGSAQNLQGRIYLNPQSWAVLSGVGDKGARGRQALDYAGDMLNSDCGLALLAPPYRGFPEPDDPPLGSSPGTNENGSIFCHANTWAIIAEALLGRGDRAWDYYRQLLPESVIAQVGEDRYAREPYVTVSSIVGPASERFGEGGISWLTGTASWLYVAATHYLLGLRPHLRGLSLRPVLPPDIPTLRIKRLFRGCEYHVELHNVGAQPPRIHVNNQLLDRTILPLETGGQLDVVCEC